MPPAVTDTRHKRYEEAYSGARLVIIRDADGNLYDVVDAIHGDDMVTTITIARICSREG